MSIADALVAEWKQESDRTRAILAVLPGQRANWKPHVKSMTMATLARHIACMPRWGLATLRMRELDLDSPSAVPYQQPPFESTAALVALFTAESEQFRAALAATPDAAMSESWSLIAGGHKVFTQPRAVALRSFVFSHMVHHRAQMTVYLRLCDLPVPGIYGPSADGG